MSAVRAIWEGFVGEWRCTVCQTANRVGRADCYICHTGRGATAEVETAMGIFALEAIVFGLVVSIGGYVLARLIRGEAIFPL